MRDAVEVAFSMLLRCLGGLVPENELRGEVAEKRALLWLNLD
jgi:hypothetical protein